MTTFVGDVHGVLEYLPKHKKFVQVGDLGIGFGVRIPDDRADMRFIRGNHDDPALCQLEPQHIGDWRLLDGVLYLGGAGSIDRAWRTAGYDWWPEEELTYAQMDEVLALPDWALVDAVVAHDAPLGVYPMIQTAVHDRFRTPRFLDEVLAKFRPRTWVCGHHHKRLKFRHEFTNFHVLAIGEARDVDVDCAALWA